MGHRDRSQRDQLGDKPTGRRRVSVPEAADLLGLTVEAIRGRIKRGTIDYERDGERVFVLVVTDKPSTSRGQSYDKPSDQSTDQHPDEDAKTRELVEEMRDRIADLGRRLDQSEEARRRADTIIMQLTQANAALSARLPEIAASPQEEPPEAPESAREGEPPTNNTTPSASPQMGTQPRSRSWWRRLIGS